MKKIFRFFSVFVISSLFFLTTSDKIFAQSVNCSCAFDNQNNQCVPSFAGGITYNRCGPAWDCQCGQPYNIRENCEGDYGCITEADCASGVCVAGTVPGGTGCNAGEVPSWIGNRNQCESPKHLSGNQRPIYDDNTGLPIYDEYECCTPVRPSPEPTRTPASSTPLPAYNPKCYGRFGEGVKSGLGCIPTDPQAFINTATPWAIGIGSGIAFLLGLYGALMIVLSAGNPEKMQAGKEMITSAITGVVILVFAVFLLDFIGVEVLKLFSF